MIEIGHRLATGHLAMGWENWETGQPPPGLDVYLDQRLEKGRSVPDITDLRGPAPRRWDDLLTSYFPGYIFIAADGGQNVSRSAKVPRLHWAFSIAEIGAQAQLAGSHEEYWFPESDDRIFFDNADGSLRISSTFARPISVDAVEFAAESNRFVRSTIDWLAKSYPAYAAEATYREQLERLGY